MEPRCVIGDGRDGLRSWRVAYGGENCRKDLLVSSMLAVRLDFERVIAGDATTAHRLAELLDRTSFSVFERIAGRIKDRWSKYVPRTGDGLVQHLLDPTLDAVSMESKGKDLIAAAEVQTRLRNREPGPTALHAHVVCPMPADGIDAFIDGVCGVAAALETGAGFVAMEPTFGLAHRIAVGSSRPKERDGLSPLRQCGRRARDWKSELIGTKLATLEWGTFLGPGHLDQIDLRELRDSGAFARVVKVSPSLAYLQVTPNPADDLSGALEEALPRAREALAPLLMDISDVNLD